VIYFEAFWAFVTVYMAVATVVDTLMTGHARRKPRL
jgi:hypothetical protein